MKMTETPLITVIVPIFKTERYLRQCVESILAQSFDDFELILVDDGSPDLCPQICDEYAKQDERIRVIHKQNGGLVSARIAGVKAAKGEYITFVDSDDWIGENRLMSAASEINHMHPDIVSCSYSAFHHSTTPYHQTIGEGFYDKGKLKNTVYGKMISCFPFYTFGIFPPLCFKFIKKSLIMEPQLSVPTEVTLGEDAAVTYRCLLSADSLSVVDDTEYYYRYNADSIIHKYDPALASKVSILLDYLFESIGSGNRSIQRQLETYSLMLLLRVIDNEKKADDVKSALKKTKSYRFFSGVSRVAPYSKNKRAVLMLLAYKFGFYSLIKIL